MTTPQEKCDKCGSKQDGSPCPLTIGKWHKASPPTQEKPIPELLNENPHEFCCGNKNGSPGYCVPDAPQPDWKESFEELWNESFDAGSAMDAEGYKNLVLFVKSLLTKEYERGYKEGEKSLIDSNLMKKFMALEVQEALASFKEKVIAKFEDAKKECISAKPADHIEEVDERAYLAALFEAINILKNLEL